jgi:hypothetical protein
VSRFQVAIWKFAYKKIFLTKNCALITIKKCVYKLGMHFELDEFQKTGSMNFRSLFFFIALIICSLSLSAQIDESIKFEKLFCKEWSIKSFEADEEELEPSPEHKNDMMIFYNNNSVKFIENMQIKSGAWQCDTLRNILTITDSETKKRSVMIILKLTIYECVLEYKDPERSGLIMHMIPKS